MAVIIIFETALNSCFLLADQTNTEHIAKYMILMKTAKTAKSISLILFATPEIIANKSAKIVATFDILSAFLSFKA